MASDLATMLLSGNAAGVAMDPAMAQIAPDIQLGQALTQQGLSTAPAYPMQALGRLAQTLAGGKILNDATGQLQGIYGNAATAAAHTLEQIDPNHPLLAGLRSPDPYSRMISLQQFPKAMLLASDTKALKTGEELRHAAPGPAVAANTGDAAAAAEAAKNPALVARAGDIKRAEAPFEGGGNVVVPGLGGPVTIPATAATRAAIQPGGPQGVPAPVTPRPPADDVVVGPGPLAGMHVPGTANAAAAAAPAAPSAAPKAPGVNATGVPLPNAAIEPMVKADTDEVHTDREAAAKGQQDMATIRAIQDFLPKVQTGWGADTKLEAARILKSAGVSDEHIQDFLHTDVASGQILQKKFLELSSAAARTMGAREPGSVIQMFAKAYPSLGTDPKAVTLQTNALYMDRVRQQRLADQKTAYLNDSINGVQSSGHYRGLTGFNEDFNKREGAERYLSAAEAMSGVPHAWARITDPGDQQAVIDLMPSGTRFLAPDNKMRVKP